jgi:hypothetical protein
MPEGLRENGSRQYSEHEQGEDGDPTGTAMETSRHGETSLLDMNTTKPALSTREVPRTG